MHENKLPNPSYQLTIRNVYYENITKEKNMLKARQAIPLVQSFMCDFHQP